MAATCTKINEGIKPGLVGRHFAEYKVVLSGTVTSGTLSDVGWIRITCVMITPTADPTSPDWWFDGTDLHFAGLATDDTFYLYVHGDRG